jgi:signal transduction histidine kinase
MRLFFRILLWFLATIFITVTGFVITSALTVDENRDRVAPFTRTVPFLLSEAREVYETGGKLALAGYLTKVQNQFGSEVIFADASGRDILTGEDRSTLIEVLRSRPLVRFRRARLPIGRAAEDGKYWLILLVPRERVGFWILQPQHLWTFGIVLLLCYWLAWHLSSPVLKLQKTVERFGEGDLSARAETGRKDEIGRLAQTFNRMAERTQTLLEAERRLLLDISHELRSPLARLGVAVELARSGGDRDKALDRIEQESLRLNSLVGELLQVTRAEGDPAAMRREAVRLDELLREIVDTAEIEAEARGARIELAEAPEFELSADAELLRRAIENVLRNAIRYTPGGAAVNVSLSKRGHSAVVAVRDLGPGVPEESLGRIFDAFYRVGDDRGRNTGGVGLGLAIARRAISLHNGKITAKNANPGLLVEIELPVSAQPAPPDAASTKPASVAS